MRMLLDVGLLKKRGMQKVLGVLALHDPLPCLVLLFLILKFAA